MASDGKCSFSQSLLSSFVALVMAIFIWQLGKFIFRRIKACRERRRRLDKLQNFKFEFNERNEGISPDNLPNFCPCGRYAHSSTQGYVPVTTDVINNSSYIQNSDMDRDIKSGIAHSQELRDLEAAIPRYHAFWWYSPGQSIASEAKATHSINLWFLHPYRPNYFIVAHFLSSAKLVILFLTR